MYVRARAEAFAAAASGLHTNTSIRGWAGKWIAWMISTRKTGLGYDNKMMAEHDVLQLVSSWSHSELAQVQRTKQVCQCAGVRLVKNTTPQQGGNGQKEQNK